MSNIQRSAKRALRSIPTGKPLRLRDGIYRQLKDREWIFNRVEKNMIFLIHKNGAYGVAVRTEDIEWNL
jgi:hypothetical protein